MLHRYVCPKKIVMKARNVPLDRIVVCGPTWTTTSSQGYYQVPRWIRTSKRRNQQINVLVVVVVIIIIIVELSMACISIQQDILLLLLPPRPQRGCECGNVECALLFIFRPLTVWESNCFIFQTFLVFTTVLLGH